MAGRPPKEPDELHGTTFRIRMKVAEREAIDAAAEHDGSPSTSEWARRVLAAAAARRLKAVDKSSR